ncbi:TPA: nucleotide exchange factor GrpE [Neisseria meningitidis]|uniref:Protein GrpE n=1 Tax=Neisseria meningitidis TaxID=487 RepID=A0A425B153_NEIME|nr:nucleotide exchange factor GrpE [Neisseria meningitidis]CCI72195.1 Protein grpE HSP-70 cofactor [Neisseria meningitidis alpha704]ANX21626.1 nucleotide exchange factor GrpE [Neisseria meningitidis]ANX22839.1 nucleotide exchange factor GrpE [Neisseria meningitidis]ANX37935.1 nucleotide exchange factor GrpE [Neisseria meningitidis]ANX50941.1 nucleotide exchange factor GrpE [Neisseria meningitidis]
MSEQTQQQNSEEAVENVEAVETVETVGNADGVQEQAAAESAYEDLQARIAELEAQLKDEQLRALANEQNLRRRHQQEIADTHKFAGQKFAVEMLPVKDYLEMALLDQSGNFDALKMGVQMTLNELQKAFDATQIKEINPKAGDKLDPNIHQAMQAVASEQEPNTVVGVMKKGYTLSDRVLRPAMVTVAQKEA